MAEIGARKTSGLAIALRDASAGNYLANGAQQMGLAALVGPNDRGNVVFQRNLDERKIRLVLRRTAKEGSKDGMRPRLDGRGSPCS